jgi:hypothetical protein
MKKYKIHPLVEISVLKTYLLLIIHELLWLLQILKYCSTVSTVSQTIYSQNECEKITNLFSLLIS